MTKPDQIVPEALTAEALQSHGLRHGFFTRRGGGSEGIYAGLNMGLGSADAREQVLANRAAAAAYLDADHLVTPYQVHGRDVVQVSGPWRDEPSRADAVVTRTPGVAVGVVTADCVPVLFANTTQGVIAAAHAGWRGTVAGILEATVDAMTDAGAAADKTVAVVGPAIAQRSYEVGDDVRDAFLKAVPEAADCFATGTQPGKYQFDLVRVVARKLQRSGLSLVTVMDLDTYGDRTRFFSYRRATHSQEPDYGRQLSAICLVR